MNVLNSAFLSFCIFSTAIVLPAVGFAATPVEYSYKTFEYSTWTDGDEKAVLNLFPGFRNVVPKDGGDLVVFLARSRVTVNKPAANIDLSKLTERERMQRIKEGIAELRVINPADMRTLKEDFLAYRNPNGGWCSRPKDLCIESVFTFEMQTQLILSGILFALGKKDTEIKAQSQVRVTSGPEIGNAEALKRLTGVNSPVTSVVTEDIFWISNAMEYGKIVGAVQPDPSNPNQSILTAYTVFTVEKKWWDRDLGVCSIKRALLGECFNGTSGLTMGLPKLTQQLFSRLLNEL